MREGKGFVAAHVGLTAFESWPEFLDLIGARFDGHPITGAGTIINESPTFLRRSISGRRFRSTMSSISRRITRAKRSTSCCGSIWRTCRRTPACT